MPSSPLTLLAFILALLALPVSDPAAPEGSAVLCVCETGGGGTSTRGHDCGDCCELGACPCSFGYTPALHEPAASLLHLSVNSQPPRGEPVYYTDIALPVPHRPPIG